MISHQFVCNMCVCVARAMETRSILQARAFIYWQVSGQLLIVKHDLFRCYRINALVAGWADAVSVPSVCVCFIITLSTVATSAGDRSPWHLNARNMRATRTRRPGSQAIINTAQKLLFYDFGGATVLLSLHDDMATEWLY